MVRKWFKGQGTIDEKEKLRGFKPRSQRRDATRWSITAGWGNNVYVRGSKRPSKSSTAHARENPKKITPHIHLAGASSAYRSSAAAIETHLSSPRDSNLLPPPPSFSFTRKSCCSIQFPASCEQLYSIRLIIISRGGWNSLLPSPSLAFVSTN